MAEKDLKRRKGQANSNPIHVVVEDIYNWIKIAFEKVFANPQGIVNCWAKAGFIPKIKTFELPKESDLDGIPLDANQVFDVENSMIIEDENPQNEEEVHIGENNLETELEEIMKDLQDSYSKISHSKSRGNITMIHFDSFDLINSLDDVIQDLKDIQLESPNDEIEDAMEIEN